MSFDALAFLTKIRGGLDLPGLDAEAASWLAEHGAEYPDIKDRADALAAYISDTLKKLAPELDPATMRNTLLGVARDLVSGQAGVDHNAWHGIG